MIAHFKDPAGSHLDSPKTRVPRRLLIIRDALIAICDGRWDDAENTLTLDGAAEPCDAALLNLLGIVYLGRRQWKHAKRCFGRAMRASDFSPAEQNLRRIYELETFGKTDLPITLVDQPTAAELASRFGPLRVRQ